MKIMMNYVQTRNLCMWEKHGFTQCTQFVNAGKEVKEMLWRMTVLVRWIIVYVGLDRRFVPEAYLIFN
jgi:hypothetical protein